MDKRPIGIFDSGVGGLTVAEKVLSLLPDERIVYLGDTARVPYGNKSRETVTRFSKEIVNFLLSLEVKLVIVACNTASSLSLAALKRTCPVPVLGVIKPGVREALKKSRTKRIGVIGTAATVSSNVYKDEIASIDKSCRVIQKACPLFVPLVENTWLGGDITGKIVKKYLQPMLKSKIDTLILGCTHYPLLMSAIRKVTGSGVALIDSSTEVAKYARSLLEKENLKGDGKKRSVRFFATDDTKSFVRLARVFLKRNIKAKKITL